VPRRGDLAGLWVRARAIGGYRTPADKPLIPTTLAEPPDVTHPPS
jgi:hypothetical protein